MELLQTHWNDINQEGIEYASLHKNTIVIIIKEICQIKIDFDAYSNRFMLEDWNTYKWINENGLINQKIKTIISLKSTLDHCEHKMCRKWK